MTNNTGKQKKYKKNYQHLNKNGARLHRRDFIETQYTKGVLDEKGNQVIRALNKEEINFLDNFYKEYVHNTFITDSESQKLYKKARKLIKQKENVEFFKENGSYPEYVLEVIESFNKKSKALGNTFYDFWDQRDINSDDYKRRYDIHNNCTKGLQLESFEDVKNTVEGDDEYNPTMLEDLITESEK